MASPDLAAAGDTSSATGALRLKSDVSQSVTTSVAKSGNITGLVVDNARANAVVDIPDSSMDAVPTASAGLARLKSGLRPSVTSTSSSIGNQQQSDSGASRLKSGVNLSVPSAADVQQHAEVDRSDNAELRSRTSNGKLISTHNLLDESDCHVDSNENGDDMECDIVEIEDGEIDEITKKSKEAVAFLQKEIDERNAKAPSKEEDTKSILKKHREQKIYEAWTDGTIFPLTQYFGKFIEGKFTSMFYIPSLDRTSLNYLKYIYPGWTCYKQKKIDEWEFGYFLENQQSFIDWKRFNLSREPLIDIDTSNNKEAAYLSALIHLHSFNDCHVKQHVCPCSTLQKYYP